MCSVSTRSLTPSRRTWALDPAPSLPTGTVQLTDLTSHQQLARGSGEPPATMSWPRVLDGLRRHPRWGKLRADSHRVAGTGLCAHGGQKAGLLPRTVHSLTVPGRALSSARPTPALHWRQDTAWFHWLGCRVGWSKGCLSTGPTGTVRHEPVCAGPSLLTYLEFCQASSAPNDVIQ